ncbi:MAG: hypothetical protein WAM71_14330, partial [Candidatus Korobacteraceae bacterium]
SPQFLPGKQDGIGAPSPAIVCWLESPQFLPGKQDGIGAPSPAIVCCWLESPQFLPGKQDGIGAPSPAIVCCWLESPQFLPGKQDGIGAPSPGKTLADVVGLWEMVALKTFDAVGEGTCTGPATALMVIKLTARAHRNTLFIRFLLVVV